MMQAIHAAIDPGRGGGWAFRNFAGLVEAGAMPEDWRELAAVIRRIMGAGIQAKLPVVFHVEQVGGYLKPAKSFRVCRHCGGPCDANGKHQKEGQPGSAMFNFGRNVGMAHGMLAMTSATVVEVPPRSWQKVFIPSGRQGRERTDWKNDLKTAAQRIFPDLNVTLRTADALLMLRYGELLESGAVRPAKTEKERIADTVPMLPGCEPDMFIARYGGVDTLFAKGGKRFAIVRKATPEDARKYPRGSFRETQRAG